MSTRRDDPDKTASHRSNDTPLTVCPGPGGVLVQGVAYRRGTFTLSVPQAYWPRGGVHAIVGPSGCGKSTLLHLLGGHLLPRSGHISVFGRSPAKHRGSERAVRTVFQHLELFPGLTVSEQLRLGIPRRLRHSSKPLVKEWLARLGLTDKGDRITGRLSGGEKQRVALGRALISSPALLLLDEPLNSLDPFQRVSLWRLAIESRAADATVLFASHDANASLRHAETVTVLVDGGVKQAGAPEEVYRRPVDATVGRLFGSVNEFTSDGRKWAVRPEDLKLHPGPSSKLLAVGTVDRISQQPGYLEVQIRLETSFKAELDLAFLAIHTNQSQVQLGAQAKVYWEPSASQ